MSIIIKVTVVAEVKIKDEEELEQFKEEFFLNWNANELISENYDFEVIEEE
jgi:hypothetical protein